MARTKFFELRDAVVAEPAAPDSDVHRCHWRTLGPSR